MPLLASKDKGIQVVHACMRQNTHTCFKKEKPARIGRGWGWEPEGESKHLLLDLASPVAALFLIALAHAIEN